MEIRDRVERDGFVFLPNYMKDRSTMAVAKSFGSLMKLNSEIPIVQTLTPNMKASVKNSYSSIYGYDEFPMHTDFAHWPLPPRFLLLRAKSQCSGVKTSIVAFSELETRIETPLFSKCVFFSRKPIMGQFIPLRICCKSRQMYRWDREFIRPASQNSMALRDKILQHLKLLKPIDFYMKNNGDTLVVDNWKMLHGRGAVFASERERSLDRVYLGDLW